MNLKSLSDAHLLKTTQDLAHKERELLTEILWHLREIERRGLYAERGYPSLFEFAVNELKYSPGAAGRRISAMRLLKELPEIEPMIQAGSVNLSTLSSVAMHIRAEKKVGHALRTDQKLELIQVVAGKSQREADQALGDRASPERKPGESIELKICVSPELLKKLNRLKELASHRVPSGGLTDLLEYMTDQLLQELEPKKPKAAPAAYATPAPESATIGTPKIKTGTPS